MWVRRNRIQALICSLSVCSLVSFGCVEEQAGTGQSVAEAESTRSAPQTDAEKVLYALGFMQGRSIKEFQFTEDEIATVVMGLADAASGREMPFDSTEFVSGIQQLYEQRTSGSLGQEAAEASKFLAEAAATEGSVRSESGLVMLELVAGEGDHPSPTDTVSVHYHGTLRDGSVFDSSVDRGAPAEFPLDGVIPCWTEALQKMAVGGKSRIICPAEIAYGSRGSGNIPGNAAIAFEVELLDIVR